MKKIIALILTLALSLCLLLSCSDYYEPKTSTKEEASVVMMLSFGEESYEVKYELYRALFLTVKKEIDNGNSDVWEGADKDEYVEAANKMIFERLCDIYSAFSIAKEIGIDPYSDEYDESVLEIVKVSVDGGTVGGAQYAGFGGNYDAYLASLKEMNLNYSVQDLMIRYALVMENIFYHYGGNVENDAKPGALGYTKEDVLEFYNSDECVRVYQLYLSSTKTSFNKEKAESLRDKIAGKNTENEVVATMISNSATGDDIKNGTIIGKYNLDAFYYSALTDGAFKLAYYETSPVIEITSADDEGFYILFRTFKDSSHFEECYDDVAKVYVENAVGKILSERADALLASLTKTEAYLALDHSKISMN